MLGMLFAKHYADKLGVTADTAAVGGRRGSTAQRKPSTPGLPPPAARPADGAVLATGIAFSVLAGVFASLQMAAVTLGKRHEQAAAGCARDPESCPPWLHEAFNNVGSWMVSFGIGALVITVVLLLLVAAVRGGMPSLHWGVLSRDGVMGGLCWAGGNVFITAAVVTGGNAVGHTQVLACTIFFSGLWGMLRYGELAGAAVKLVWGVSAAWTLVCMVFLGMEKA